MTFSFWAVYLIIAVYTFLLFSSSREIFRKDDDDGNLSDFILIFIVSIAFPLLLLGMIIYALTTIYQEGKTK